MINRINFEKLNAAMRLFIVYAEQGLQKDEAINKSSSKLGERYSREFSLLKDVFSEESSSTKKVDKQGISFFQSLKDDIASSGGDTNKALLEVSRVMRITSTGFKACAHFYQAIYTYPVIITIVAVLVYTQYKLFVFDSISTHFSTNGTLPKLSQFIFSDLTAIVILIFVTVIAFFFISIIRAIKHDFALFKPNHSWFSKTLFCGTDQSYLLFLLYLKTLLACGSNTESAIEKSKRYAKIHDSNGLLEYRVKHDVLTAISSESNDVISSEVDFQLQAVTDEIEDKLISKQEKVLIFFQFIIFIFVGYMVIAMYLPIFKLGGFFS